MRALRPTRLSLFPLIAAREKLAGGERTRDVGGEPAVMDEPQGVQEYDEFGTVGEVGTHTFAARGISGLLPKGAVLLDLGCGSGRLLARLARSRPDVRIIGLDLSEPMLETGRRTLEQEGLSERVELRRGDITTFDADLHEHVDAISCNFALHHMPTEEIASRCLEAIARVRSRTGCAVWIYDFARLRHPGSWPGLVSMVNWPGPVVHSDAIESERAAFSAAELATLLERAGLGGLEHVRSRPIGEFQVAWAPARDHPEKVTGVWEDQPLPREQRFLVFMALQSFPRRLTRT